MWADTLIIDEMDPDSVPREVKGSFKERRVVESHQRNIGSEEMCRVADVGKRIGWEETFEDSQVHEQHEVDY